MLSRLGFPGDAAHGLSLEELSLRHRITDAVIAASLDVDSVAAEVFAAGTGLGIVSGLLQFSKTTSSAGDAVGFAAGGVKRWLQRAAILDRAAHATTWLLDLQIVTELSLRDRVQPIGACDTRSPVRSLWKEADLSSVWSGMAACSPRWRPSSRPRRCRRTSSVRHTEHWLNWRLGARAAREVHQQIVYVRPESW